MIVEHSAGKRKVSVLAIEHICEPHLTIVQCAGNDYYFKSRTWLSDICYDAIAPHVRISARTVWIEVRQRRQRKNFARSRTHYDSRNADRRMLFHRIREGGLNDVLNHRVD